MHTFIAHLVNQVGAEVTIRGWLANKRSSGSIAFLEIRDGSGFIQAVVDKARVQPDVWQRVNDATQESAVAVTGIVSQHPKKEGVFELRTTGLEVIQLAAEYPIGNKEHGPDFLL